MRLKLRFPDSSEIVTLTGSDGTDNSITLQDLNDKIVQKLPSALIKAGFPPKPVETSDPTATLVSLGIKNGEQLVIELKSHEKPLIATNQPSLDTNLLEQKLNKTSLSNDTRKTAPIFSKKLADQKSSGFSTSKVSKLPGSKAKPSLPSKKDLVSKVSIPNVSDDLIQVKCGAHGYLRLRVMEDDNSCLFRAVGYTVLKDLDSMFSLRDAVRDAIIKNPEQYSDAILGKKREVYMSWICQENSWGGAIELDILAKNFGLTICSLDISTLRQDMFNPGQDRFVIIAYSGIHYDAIALSKTEFDSGRPEDDQTIFEGDMKGMEVLEALQELGKKLKNKHYYTDTAKFSIRCNTCSTLLTGEKEATKHASATGHTDFGEY